MCATRAEITALSPGHLDQNHFALQLLQLIALVVLQLWQLHCDLTLSMFAALFIRVGLKCLTSTRRRLS